MAVSYTDIQALPSGEFSSLTQTQIEEAIDLATAITDADYFGDNHDLAVKYLAAHFLVQMVEGGTAPAGPLTSRSAGIFSQSFGGASASTDYEFGTTVYGKAYHHLVQTSRYKTWGMIEP